MFEGSMVAIVTPFEKGKLDEKALTGLVKWHLRAGTDAIIPCGTTGESATLDNDTHLRVIELTVKAVGGKVPVIAGTGANSTEEAVMLTKGARKLGADGSLQVTPYYNKPSQEGLYQHYKKIAASVKGFPLVLYNVPGRTALNMLPETVARLSQVKSIVAIKEATADMKQATEIMSLCGDDINVLSGDDFTTFTLYTLGGKGSISVSANVAPNDAAKMWDAWKAGKVAQARKYHYKMHPLNKAMFIETNPVPVKTALAMMGKIREEFKLPLCSMSKDNKAKLKKALKAYGLI